MTETLTLPVMFTTRCSWFATGVGFFFAFRVAATLLAFQSNPVMGSGAVIATLLLLFVAVVVYAGGQERALLWQRPQGAVRWLFALIGLSFFSLLWTGASSRAAAAAYWVGMATEFVLVLLLLRDGNIERVTTSLMKGFVVGAGFVALVAWCSPVTVELRLGDDIYLHPNTLGMEAAVGALLAQFLTRRGEPYWKWPALVLVVTLARTLSKTAILSYVVAEAYYLFANRALARRAKVAIVAGGVVLAGCLWSVTSAYLAIYNTVGGGTQAETLTGRTIVWTTALSMGMERPLFGHGMYSFRSLIPSFGNFLPIHAHNEWIHLFFELGLVGLTAGAGAYVSFYRQARRARASELRLLCISLVIFTVLHSFADTVPYGLSFPLWLMVALSVWMKREQEVC